MFGFWKWGGRGWDGLDWDGMDRYTIFIYSRVFTYDYDFISLLLRGEGGVTLRSCLVLESILLVIVEWWFGLFGWRDGGRLGCCGGDIVCGLVGWSC